AGRGVASHGGLRQSILTGCAPGTPAGHHSSVAADAHEDTTLDCLPLCSRLKGEPALYFWRNHRRQHATRLAIAAASITCAMGDHAANSSGLYRYRNVPGICILVEA